jgi:site-specific recombinase XerD
MTTLRQRFIRELVIRGISSRTQESYIAAVCGLAKHYQRPPDQLSDEQLKQYVFYLAQERKLAPASLNLTAYAIRSFYQLVLQRPIDQLRLCLPSVKQAVHRPQVFSVGEMEKLLTVGCLHLKHRVFLMTVYGAGLRLNEACHLKPEHIDSARMVVRVEEGKGRKDRYSLLSPRLLQELRTYWRAVRPGPWLFFGRDRQLPLPEGTGQHIFNHAVQRAGLPKKGGIHSLRHSFATHLLESGVEITVVQKLLGHSSLSSTVTYLHVRRERVAQIQSPLHLLHLDQAGDGAPTPSQ